MERHRSQSKSIAMLLSNVTLSWLFVKYNIPTLSRATVERLFSLGKDAPKQKRSVLSDPWWIYRVGQENHLPQASPF